VGNLDGVDGFNTRQTTIERLEGKLDPKHNSSVGFSPRGINGTTPVLDALAAQPWWKKGGPVAPPNAVTAQPLSQALAVTGNDTTLVDIDQADGFKSLGHKIKSARDKILAGEHDARLREIMDTPLVMPTGYGNAVYTLPDGTEHGDPYMALFAKDFDGDQQALNLPTAAFNAVKAMTGRPSCFRSVSTVQQRDAIKKGNHFTGTGVYGNGVYTGTNRGVTRGYGSATVEMTPKPGAGGIDNEEAFVQQAEDIAETIRSRSDLLSAVGFPTKEEIDALVDLEHWKKADYVYLGLSAFKDHAFSSGVSLDDEYENASFKAAVAYAGTLAQKGWMVQPGIEADRYSYSAGRAKFTVTATSPEGAKLQMTFKAPWTQSQTSYGRSTVSKLDKKKHYGLSVVALKAVPGSKAAGEAEARQNKSPIRQQYNSGWFIEHFGNAMQAVGLVEDQELLDKIAEKDARITFISDTGRWALAAGYDWLYIPGQDFYIFTHRAAFIVKS
jgi:hypothetical protein